MGYACRFVRYIEEEVINPSEGGTRPRRVPTAPSVSVAKMSPRTGGQHQGLLARLLEIPVSFRTRLVPRLPGKGRVCRGQEWTGSEKAHGRGSERVPRKFINLFRRVEKKKRSGCLTRKQPYTRKAREPRPISAQRGLFETGPAPGSGRARFRARLFAPG